MVESAPPGLVLLVEDEPLLLRAYARWLESAGMIVVCASDGSIAKKLIATKKFDVIVSDLAMPGTTGVQLLRAVREHDLDVPVILITGTPTLATAIQAVDLGALRYLVKPFDEAVLLEAVTRAHRLHRLAKLKREAMLLVGHDRNQVGDLAGLGASLDRALATLWMAYQPIVIWSTRQIYGFEALLRCDEPTLPTPDAIFHAAQRLGRVEHLGQAIRDAVAATMRETARTAVMFVNLHPRELLDEALYSPTAALSQVAERVVLEITERESLDDIDGVTRRVAKLRAMGFRIAVDDLGAGFAGLTSFAQLEPEVVKFDMSLVRGLHDNAIKQKLIRAMTTLFGELAITTISEGVETAAERDALVSCGCDVFQGYLFARPGKSLSPVSW
jgi:EAL domain-containing protein (putative c-di-GMP-specific phosphodiesterase class I)